MATQLRRITIGGLRGFAKDVSVDLAVPNGKRSSGLTVLVGANNAGKSTVLEAIKLAGGNQQPEVTSDQANNAYGGKWSISYEMSEGDPVTLLSIAPGSYQTKWSDGAAPLINRVYTVPARRSLPASFGKSTSTREAHATQSAQMTSDRSSSGPGLQTRMMHVLEDRDVAKPAFDKVVSALLGYDLAWDLQKVQGENFVFSIDSGTGKHTSDGLGLGVVSVFYVVAALFDAAEGAVVCIDEPELSMHPQVQRRVADYIADRAAEVQIIVSTHSPYFVDPVALSEGAGLVRCFVKDATTKLSRLTDGTRGRLEGLVNDFNNPHVLGLDAREIFFAEEGVLVVEGQEDVIMLRKIEEQLGRRLPHTFFGWGAGGYAKVELILSILHDLGFDDVTSLLDGNQPDTHEKLKSAFPAYKHRVLPTDDIRDKEERHIAEKAGVCTDKGKLKPEFVDTMKKLFTELGAE